MRQLQYYIGMKLNWKGTITHFGFSKKNNQKTILLTNIKCKEFNIEIDHMWIIYDLIELNRGDIIKFICIIKPYRKGTIGNILDYGFDKIQGLSIIGQDPKLNPIKKLAPSKRINIKNVMTKESTIP